MPRKPTVPAFTSDRLLLLGPLITERVLELARQRILEHKRRIDKEADDLPTKRLALLLVREMNPVAALTNEEEGILRGIDADTIGKMRTKGDL